MMSEEGLDKVCDELIKEIVAYSSWYIEKIQQAEDKRLFDFTAYILALYTYIKSVFAENNVYAFRMFQTALDRLVTALEIVGGEDNE